MASSMERAVVAGGMTVMRGSAHVTLRSTVTARAAFATPSMSGSGSEWVWLNWRRAGGMWWRSPTPMPTPRSDLSPLELRRRCRRTGGSSNEEWHVSDSYTYTIYIHYNVTLLQDILVYPFKLELITCQISNVYIEACIPFILLVKKVALWGLAKVERLEGIIP